MNDGVLTVVPTFQGSMALAKMTSEPRMNTFGVYLSRGPDGSHKTLAGTLKLEESEASQISKAFKIINETKHDPEDLSQLDIFEEPPPTTQAESNIP